MADKLTPCAALRKLVEVHEPVWRPYWDAIKREVAFLEGDRYEPGNGIENTDERLTEIRGQELQETIRDFCAEATARPRSVEPRPTDHEDDAPLGEAMAELVERELKDPWKGFTLHEYECVYDSRVRRHGVLWMDYERDFGEYGGEIFFRTLDPTTCMWESCYHPHHPLCGWFFYKLRMPVVWIHENYPKTKKWLKSDQMASDDEGLTSGRPLARNAKTITSPAIEDDKAELWFCWYKNDQSTKQRDSGEEMTLEPDQRYMSCANGCGYRSPTQGDLLAQGKLENELPVSLDGCPDCAEAGDEVTLTRIDRRGLDETVRAYPRGKRMVMMAGQQQSPEDEPIYDGKWPVPTARSFPGLFLFSEVDPRKPTGKSDIYWMWDQQKAADTLRTLALQRVLENRTYWLMSAAGIEAWNGQRFGFRNDQFNVAYVNQAKLTQGPPVFEPKSASGLDATGWSLAMNYTLQALTQHRSIVDYGLSEDNSKNIAVGTVQQLTKQGKISIEEYIRRKSQALSQFYGVVDDYIRAIYTPQRLERLNIEGKDLLMKHWGDDMPRFDYNIEETPDFAGLDKAKAEAHNALLQVVPQAIQLAMQLGLPADSLIDSVTELFADTNNLPRSVLRKFQGAIKQAKEEARAAADQQMAQGGGAQDAGGGMDAAAADPAQALMAEIQGSGMAPEPVQ